MWVPNPSDIVTFRASGFDNMGDVTDDTSVARFSLPVDRYALVWARMKFAGGTGTGTVSLKLDHRMATESFNFTLMDWPTMGTTGTAWDWTRMTADEQHHWVFHRGDALVFEWTNPDAAVMEWSVEVGLADATEQ